MCEQKNCVIVRMPAMPNLSLEDLRDAVKYLQSLKFDVQIAKMDDQTIIAALGLGQGSMAEIRRNIPKATKVEVAPFYKQQYGAFQESWDFLRKYRQVETLV